MSRIDVTLSTRDTRPMTKPEGDAVTENRNNSPVFTDDEACIAYDALGEYLRTLEGERRWYMEANDEIPGGLLRAIAAGVGARDKLGHDR